MIKKTPFICLMLILGTIVSCGDNEAIAPSPQKYPISNVDPILDDMLNQLRLPLEKESMTQITEDKVPLAPGKYCAFEFRKQTKVAFVKNNGLELSINEKSTPAVKNPPSCFQVVRPNGVRRLRISRQAFLHKLEDKLIAALKPQTYCQKRPWCIDFRLIEQAQVLYKGQNSILTRSEFRDERGDWIERVGWVSINSTLLGEFEFKLRLKSSGKVLDFKTYTGN